MRDVRTPLALLGMLWVLALAACPARAADPGQPGAALLRILPIVKQAASWEPIFPELSYDYRRFVERRDAAAQARLLVELKQSLDLRELAITRARVVRRDAELDVTALDASGRKVEGTIDMELERGGWRLDDLSWSPIEPE